MTTQHQNGGRGVNLSGRKDAGRGDITRTRHPGAIRAASEANTDGCIAVCRSLLLLLLTGCGGAHVAPPSNPFPAAAWVHERTTNDPVASPSLPWVPFSLHALVTTNCLPIGTTNDGPYLQFQHAGSLWYYVNWTNKGPDGGTVEFTTRYLTQP